MFVNKSVIVAMTTGKWQKKVWGNKGISLAYFASTGVCLFQIFVWILAIIKPEHYIYLI